MKNYIILDTKQYMTVFGEWQPLINKPSSVRYLWNGNTDVTYGPGLPQEWRGMVRVPVTASGSWGSISNMRTTLMKKQSVSFTDHYEETYSVHIIGEITEDSFTPGWDNATNVFHIPVRLVKVEEDSA
jgi:hypothetical protein